MPEKFRINKTLIWDYNLEEGCYDTEDFQKWYISRVLSCGTKNDILELGIDIIKKYFSELNLPNRTRQFWEWYFNYAHIN